MSDLCDYLLNENYSKLSLHRESLCSPLPSINQPESQKHDAIGFEFFVLLAKKHAAFPLCNFWVLF